MLNSLDSSVGVSGSSAEIGAVETVAKSDGLTIRALDIKAVRRHGSFFPRVSSAIGKEEMVNLDVPAEIFLVDFVCFRNSGLGECFGEHERALTLNEEI